MLSQAAHELELLLATSTRIGREPLLVQAASGNTSVKLDGRLFVKASGKWLAHAEAEDILIPVDLDDARRRIDQGIDPAGQSVLVNGTLLGTSVETAMHAVLPHRVVLHVHSVNTIAWAVRADGRANLETRLIGMEWQWVPYVPSGLALARGVADAMARNPQANVLVLANHGLVVCGDSCDEAEAVLAEVECRLAAVPRISAEPDAVRLQNLAASATGWRVPRSSALHEAAIDPVSRRILMGGTLYPCQAIFLTRRALGFSFDVDAAELRNTAEPFVLVEGAGMLVRENLNAAALLTLEGLAQLLRRIPERAPVRYLSDAEVNDLLCADVYKYRERVEGNIPLPPAPPPAVVPQHAARTFQELNW